MQEKIKEEWKKLGFEPTVFDECGWVDYDDLPDTFDIGRVDAKKYEKSHQVHGTLLRPKSLRGIEDNNGWIKIFSEADLPKYPLTMFDNCWSRRIDGFISVIEIRKLTHDNHSHWKLIEDTEPPRF